MNSKINYRPDIDGLRAIAVLSVVFYHAGIKWFSGGYVGVDVFFVISGYLITTIIVREIEAKEFSFVRFYERRIRRIYPALYVTIALVLLAAFLLYDPVNFKQVSQSAIAATLFLSNVLFWKQAGYFDAPSSLKPLLHTWSLAVEEQFYIVFPWLIFLILRFARKHYKTILSGMALTSFFLSVYYTREEPSSAFYFFHLRAWELILGGLLAVNTVPSCTNTVLRNILSLAGVAMILASVFIFTQGTPFPGTAALLPTIGSALVIYSGLNETTLVGKALSMSPIVFIGKISYSLYLFHWPIIIYAKYYSIQGLTSWNIIMVIIICLVAASLSWKFIENPFRSRSFLQKPKIFIFAGIVMVVTIAFAGEVYINNGFPERFHSRQYAQIFNAEKQSNEWMNCDNTAASKLSDLVVCNINAGAASPSFLLWGDSHARALAPGVEISAQTNDVSGILIARSACPPLLDVERVDEVGCSAYNDLVTTYIEAHPELKTVILAGRWALSADGEPHKGEDKANVILVDNMSSIPRGQNAEIFKVGLDRTVAKLIEMNRNVVIVSSIPEIGYDVPSSYFIALRTDRDVNMLIAPTYNEYLRRNRMVLDVMDEILNRYNVQLLDPSQILCDQARCQVVVDGNPLYRDSHHLSTFGSQYVSNIFDTLFEKLARASSQ